jgi:hypothetical protein
MMSLRHGSPKRVMTLFSLLMSLSLLIFPLIVTNSSQGLLDAWTTGMERSLQVADGREAKVETIRTLSLLLHDGSTLYLN